MASGVVSGAVALSLQAQPGLSPDQVKATIMQTANKNVLPLTSSVTDSSGHVYVAYDDVFTVGAGYLDINAAVAASGNGLTLPVGTAMSLSHSSRRTAATLSL